MRYLKKDPQSAVLSKNLSYSKESERKEIKKLLRKEQFGFCAYSERYIKHTDASDIEHFDPRLKPTPQDSYYNWYAVLTWMNWHKAKKLDQRFLPILNPSDADIRARIRYKEGEFEAIDPNDIEATHLIEFLGFNKPELIQDRNIHVDRIKNLKVICGEDDNLFHNHLIKDKDNLSFASALEAEFGLDVDALIAQAS